jgi:DNA-binding Xre family transcriptional regulator
MENRHLGSDFDDFLKEEGTLAEVEAAAVKRVIAFEIEEMMKEKGFSKTAMARRMATSRSALERLLNPGNVSVTLHTLERTALASDKRLKIELSL